MARTDLTPVQVRVIGALLEKERTTPDNYPLTMNGLLAAANQTSNRSPVVHLEEPTVANALSNLRSGGLVRIVYSRSNRADRYRHVLDEVLGFDPAELAVMCVLMLRGPQTGSELRARTERLHRFESQRQVDEVLGRLAARQEPVVTLLSRQSGQKEVRWSQLLGGQLPTETAPGSSTGDDRPTPTSASDRIAVLEARVDALAEAVSLLQADLGLPDDGLAE